MDCMRRACDGAPRGGGSWRPDRQADRPLSSSFFSNFLCHFFLSSARNFFPSFFVSSLFFSCCESLVVALFLPFFLSVCCFDFLKRLALLLLPLLSNRFPPFCHSRGANRHSASEEGRQKKRKSSRRVFFLPLLCPSPSSSSPSMGAGFSR